MSRQLLAFVPLIALLFSGCQSSNNTPPPAPPVAPDQLFEVRAEYMQDNPAARVALVTGVLPAEHLVTVQYARQMDFSFNDIVSIIDSRRTLITHGTIIDARGDRLTIQYQETAPKAPAPAVGDLVIRFAK